MKKFIAAILVVTLLALAFNKFNKKTAPTNPTPTPPTQKKHTPPPTPEPIPEPIPTVPLPNWITYPAKQQHKNNLYDDILAHTLFSKNFGDRNTTAHETNHHVEADIRNQYYQKYKNPSAFYVGNDKALILENPKFRLSNVRDFIPPKLRFGRYQLYFVQQANAWNEQPLYAWNEWNCYVNGFQVDVEDAEQGKTRSASDDILSVTEFTIYALAVGLAQQELDPNYTHKKEFEAFLRWNTLRAQNLVKRGSKYTHLHWQFKNLQPIFKNSKEAEPLRKYMQNTLKIDLNQFFDGVQDMPENTINGPTPLPKICPSAENPNTLLFLIRPERTKK